MALLRYLFNSSIDLYSMYGQIRSEMTVRHLCISYVATVPSFRAPKICSTPGGEWLRQRSPSARRLGYGHGQRRLNVASALREETVGLWRQGLSPSDLFREDSWDAPGKRRCYTPAVKALCQTLQASHHFIIIHPGLALKGLTRSLAGSKTGSLPALRRKKPKK